LYSGTLDWALGLDWTGTGKTVADLAGTSAKRGAAINETTALTYLPQDNSKFSATFQLPGVVNSATTGELATFRLQPSVNRDDYVAFAYAVDPAYGTNGFTVGSYGDFTFRYDTLIFDFDATSRVNPSDFYRGRIYVNGGNVINIEGTSGPGGDITGLFSFVPGLNNSKPFNQFYYDGTVFDTNGIAFSLSENVFGGIRRNFATGLYEVTDLTPIGQLRRYATDFTITYAGIFAPPGGVPEPSVWALLIAGFGVVGSTVRKRRSGMRLAMTGA